MGAYDFIDRESGPDLSAAFDAARSAARYEYGDGGYSGTVAEKGTVRLVRPEPFADYGQARAYVEDLMYVSRALPDDIYDKWGPAGAVRFGADGWLFFGYAPS